MAEGLEVMWEQGVLENYVRVIQDTMVWRTHYEDVWTQVQSNVAYVGLTGNISSRKGSTTLFFVF